MLLNITLHDLCHSLWPHPREEQIPPFSPYFSPVATQYFRRKLTENEQLMPITGHSPNTEPVPATDTSRGESEKDTKPTEGNTNEDNQKTAEDTLT